MKHFSWLFAFLVFVSVSVSVSVPVLAEQDNIPASKAQIELSFAPLVKKVAPSVVNIYTSRVVVQYSSPFMNDPFFQRFFEGRGGFGGMRGIPSERVQNSLGSGVIVTEEGLIVTNAHVVKDADKITVSLMDGREFEAEKVLVDEPSDLALLQLDEDDLDEELPFVELKPSEGLEVGDLVLAIGNPFGVGQTVTSGIVSALARSTLDINDFNFFIQTDAAINPGNSGGPLVAMDGRVVGINTAIFSRSGGSLGIGFAVPSEMVASVIAAHEGGGISDDKGILRPWLGLNAQKVTSDIADSLDLARPKGVLIAKLHNSSPLKKAGAKQGDVVLSINGKTVLDPAELKFRMATVPLGDRADFQILRDGKTQTLRVEAMAPPEDPPRDETVLSGAHPLDGSTVANLNPALIHEYGLKYNREGVVVMVVKRNSQALRIVRPGDIIVSVNGKDIEDVKDLVREIKKPSQAWQFVISRGGQTRQIILR